MKIHTFTYITSIILAFTTLLLVAKTINHNYVITNAANAEHSLTTNQLSVIASDNVYNSQDEVVKPKKVVYLTFDDGPSIHTKKLLNILDKYGVKATFFVVGNNGSYSWIKKATNQGHTIGLHSYSHRYEEIYSSKAAYLKDLAAIQDVVYESTGKKTSIIRFPGGSSNLISASIKKGIMTELTKTVTDQGYHYFDWNVDSGDGSGHLTRQQIAHNVIEGIKCHDTSIVLQHDIWLESIYAVEDIIKWGLANGYSFAPLTTDSFHAHHKINN